MRPLLVSKRKAYAFYETWIKAAIAATGKTDLFPHLKIPRMTACHWVHQDYAIDELTTPSLGNYGSVEKPCE